MNNEITTSNKLLTKRQDGPLSDNDHLLKQRPVIMAKWQFEKNPLMTKNL